MKIIHTGDFHLDSVLNSHLDGDKAKHRRDELFDAFERVVSYAKTNNINVIILAGDVFDVSKTRKPTKTAFLKLIKNNSDIDFIYALGNHDENSLDIPDEEFPSNLYMGTDTWQEKRYDNVSIHYINFNDNTEKILYNTLNLDKNDKNIVVLHGEVTDYTEDGKIQLNKLKNKNVNYLALGHIHMNSINVLEEETNSIYVYCGCLEGRGFDEEGEKGFYVIDTDDISNPKFVVNSQRIIYKFNVAVDDCDHWIDFKDKVKDVVKDVRKEDIVEIILEGKYPESFVKDIDDLKRILNSNFYFGKVKDKSKLKIDYDKYKNSNTFKGHFINMVKASSQYSDDEKEEIIEVGLHAMMGDEF